MLDVENNLAALALFKGRALSLIPGHNAVDERLFAKVFDADPILRHYVESGTIVPTLDGKPWRPDFERAAPTKAKPAHAPVPSVEVAKKGTTKVEEPEAQPDGEPTPVGGGVVPGTSTQAKATVAATDDAGRLREWLLVEKRSSVLRAIRKRLKDLTGEDVES